MKCASIRNCISDYIDGHLGDQTREMVESHIRVCSECSEYVRSTQRMLARLRSLRVDHANINIWSSVQERLPAVPARHWQDYVMRPLALVPACAVALFLIIALLLPVTRAFDRPAPGLTSAEFHQYMGAHARMNPPQALSDPDVRFVSTELQYMSPVGGDFGK